MGSQTFDYNGTTGADGSAQDFVVPGGVHHIQMELYGASGAGAGSLAGIGYGGRIQAVIEVTPGETLKVYVGGKVVAGGGRTAGGFNGGGASAGEIPGGGATDVRRTPYALANRLIVAGGGGRGGLANTRGGDGGYPSGTAASPSTPFGGHGSGGTQSAGGAGGNWGPGTYFGQDGSLGQGGHGHAGNPGGDDGGGGGGGLYGGGGGVFIAGPGGQSGGGGGSSSVPDAGATAIEYTNGVHDGHGTVVFSWEQEHHITQATAMRAV